MLPIVSFIGWHDSGKTTLATRVVRHLKEKGYRIAVIKSSKDCGIAFDTPDTDTAKHREAGADSVLFVAPDQMVMITDNQEQSLFSLAHQYFSTVDIVIAEGFKDAAHVAKIEVVRKASAPRLKNQVHGVIAIASDEPISGDYIFRLDESEEIAAFIEKRFLLSAKKETDKASLFVNGNRMVLKEFVQDALAGTVSGFVEALKLGGNAEIRDIELHIKFSKK